MKTMTAYKSVPGFTNFYEKVLSKKLLSAFNLSKLGSIANCVSNLFLPFLLYRFFRSNKSNSIIYSSRTSFTLNYCYFLVYGNGYSSCFSATLC
jgi:hypothetical protein